MKKSVLLFLIFFATNYCCSAQSSELGGIKSNLNQITDSLGYVDALNRMAMLWYEKDIDSTFFYTVKARAISDRLNYDKGKADATNNLGVFFDIKGNLQLALRYYSSAYISYVKIKDSSNQVQTMMNIAMVYKQLGRDKRAIERYNAALKMGNSLSKDSIMSLAIYNYVLEFPEKFGKAERVKLINRAKNIATRYKDGRTLLAIEQLIADEMIKNVQRAQGLKLLSNTIDSALNKHLFYVSMDLFLSNGDHLIDKDPKLAITNYEKGLAIANENGYLIYSKVMAKKLFDYYISQGNHIMANKYGQELVSAIEKQEELANNSGVDYLDYAIKEQQVQTLVAKARYQKTLSILSFIACLFAIAITFFIRQNLKRTKKLNKLISEQNNITKETLIALEKSESDNAKMIKIAAQDLRSPIGGIYAAASLMMEDEGRTTDDIELLEAIKQSADNSLTLVKELLEVQFSGADFKRELLDISEMLNYCVNLLQSKAQSKRQNLQLQTFELNLKGSRDKLWRVVSNLISNAIKFSPDEAIIKIAMQKKQHSVLISVADSGIGISEEMQDKVFELYTDAKREGTAGEETYGLGLFISKQIVLAHNGKIWCESVPGLGSTFYVELPILPLSN